MKLKELTNMIMAGVMTASLAAYSGSDTAKMTAADAAATAKTETIAVVEDAETKETEVSEAPAAGGIAKEGLKISFVYIDGENKSYTAAHYNGAMEMKEKLSLNDDQITAKRDIPKDGTVKNAAMDLADQGYRIISANSLRHGSYVIEVAKEYPNIQFRHTTGFQTISSGLSNVHNYFTSIYKSRYMSGVVAELKLNQMIEDGTAKADVCKTGYVGAYLYAEVISGYTFSFLDVRSVCPDVTMKVKHANSWASFDLKKEATNALISDGCILISQHAGTTDAPTACRATGVPYVGYNISVTATALKQAPTSASSNWAAYVTETVQHVIDRTGIPVDQCKGFSDGAVLITELDGAAVVPGAKEKMNEVEVKLASDKLHVLDTSTWTVGGETLDIYKKDGSDIEYISGGYSHESEFGPAPALDILIDGITTTDN